MINFHSQDNSFFKVESPDIDSAFSVMTKNVISFSYIEATRRMNTGTISLYDPNHVYSKLLRAGANLNISFGYQEPPLGIRSLLGDLTADAEFYGASTRENIKAIIQHPAGNLGSDGRAIYNINFFGSEYNSTFRRIIHRVSTRFNVIQTVMARLNIPVQFIDFNTATKVLTENTYVLQRESDYKFLIRLAHEWQTIFRIGYNQLGQLVGIFIDYSKVNNPIYTKALTGAIGGSVTRLDWRTPNANVLSCSWSQKAGLHGGGDSVRIVLDANGRPQFFRYVADQQTVRVFRLVPERIEAELRNQGNFASRLDLLSDWLKITDFDQIRRFFDEVDQTTVPQGYGYEMKIKTYGNTMHTSPSKCQFGSGFPDIFEPSDSLLAQTHFYINSVTHKIDMNGYFNDVQIADALSITGGSYI